MIACVLVRCNSLQLMSLPIMNGGCLSWLWVQVLKTHSPQAEKSMLHRTFATGSKYSGDGIIFINIVIACYRWTDNDVTVLILLRYGKQNKIVPSYVSGQVKSKETTNGSIENPYTFRILDF